MITAATRWRWSRYQPVPPAWDYGAEAEVRRLSVDGDLYLNNCRWRISEALAGEPIRLERTAERILLYYCNTLVRELDLAGQRSTRVDRCPQPNNTDCKGSPDNTL